MADQALAPGRVKVPFVDLSLSHGPIGPALLADIATLINEGAFTNGPQVAEFEAAFAEYCGTAHCVGLASGLDALRLALIASGIVPGDEVIVPANTFIATFEAISQAGGRPVPVDVSESDLELDVEAASSAITPRTRFLMPVHLHGQLTDMSRLRRLAGRHDLQIVEDAAQAHGAERDGLRAGAAGTAGAFSFYPSKNLGAFGDAGAVCTDRSELAEHVHALREHGQRRKYVHDLEGYTARLDTIQALVLLHKLPFLDAWNDERRQVAGLYLEALDGVGDLDLPPVPEGSNPVWHLFVIRTRDPSALGDFLAERGISTARHYPQPAHLSEAYARLGYTRGAFPVAEALADRCLSLPIYPGISHAQLEAVVSAVGDFFHVG